MDVPWNCLTYIVIVLLSSVSFVDPGKVLFLTTPWYSHVNSNVILAEELFKKYGHISTIITNKEYASKFQTKPFLKFILGRSFEQFDYYINLALLAESMCTHENFSLSVEELYHGKYEQFCKTLLSDNDLFDILNSSRFDVVILPSTSCFNILAHNLSLPRIHVAVPFDFANWRVPFVPSVTKTVLNDFPNIMTFFQRVENTLVALKCIFLIHYSAVLFEQKFYGPGIKYKTVEELEATYQFILMDSDPILDFPIPLLPNMAHVGGMSVRKPQPLSGQLKTFMDSNKDVIIVSFGSEPLALPKMEINILIAALKQIPTLKFVFKIGKYIKYEENIMMLPWIPQNDLLAHPHTKAFITHCGNNGQYEALYNAVPMIGVPLFWDQYHNAQRISSKGFGIILDFCSIDEKTVVDAIFEILKEQYKYAISNASRIYQSYPMEPIERAAFWIDHVIEYGGDYLQQPYLPFHQYYLLDVLGFILGVIVFILSLLILICVKCCHVYSNMKIKKD